MCCATHVRRSAVGLALGSWLGLTAVWAQAQSYPQVRVGNGYVTNPVPEGHGGVNPRIPGISGDGHYGYTRKNADGSLKKHHGVDFTAPVGTPVRAPVSGWVVPVPNNGTAGNEVQIIDANGRTHRLMHLQDGSLPNKQGYIEAGQTVANVGGTGNVGPQQPYHVHYEIRDRNWQSIEVESVHSNDPATKARQQENYYNSIPSDHPQSQPQYGPPKPMPEPSYQSTGYSPAPAGNQPTREAAQEPASWLDKAGRVIKEGIKEAIFGKDAHGASLPPGEQAGQIENQIVPNPSQRDAGNRPDFAGNAQPQDDPAGTSRLPQQAPQQQPVPVPLPQSTGHIPREQSIVYEDEVGDHTPGALPTPRCQSTAIPKTRTRRLATRNRLTPILARRFPARPTPARPTPARPTPVRPTRPALIRRLAGQANPRSPVCRRRSSANGWTSSASGGKT